MEQETSMVEAVTKSELMGLASWDKERSEADLLGFITRREAEIFATEA